MIDLTQKSVEVVFITFDDVVKSPFLNIMKALIDDAEELEEYFDIDDIPEKDDDILAWLSIRENYNPLEDVALYEDISENFLDALNAYCGEGLYDGPLLEIGKNVENLVVQAVVKEVLLYTPIYDIRVEKCIEETFANKKPKYVYGEFSDIVKQHKPTTFILNNIEYLNALYVDNIDLLKYSNVLLSKHRFNFILKDDEELGPYLDIAWDEELGVTPEVLEKLPVKVALFSPYHVRSENFDFLIEGLKEELGVSEESDEEETEDDEE